MIKHALELALNALETTDSNCGSAAFEREQEAIAAIRGALAEPLSHEPENEPYVSLVSQQVQAERSIPKGFALVPLRPTPAMEDIFQQDDWQWVDVLAAAESVTEEQYLFALEDAEQAQPAYPAEWATFLHYPQCWDTAAYPTLHDAIHEALAWSGCSCCKQAQLDRAGLTDVQKLDIVTNWQKIETAPKHEKVLLWSTKHTPHAFIGLWDEYDEYNQPRITHWMLLPPPPKDKQ